MVEDSAQQPASSSPLLQSPLSRVLLQEIHRVLENKDNVEWERLEDLIEQLLTVDPSNPEIESLRKRIVQISREQLEKKVYNETRELCLSLWDREQELVSARLAGEEILQQLFRPAVDNVLAAMNDFPESMLLKGLLNEARANYNIARRTYEAKSTSDQTQDYRALLELWQALEMDKLLPWTDEHGLVQTPITVKEAIQKVERLAEQFAHSKTLEYLEAAQKHLDDNKPRASESYIKKGLDLFKLSNTDRTQLNEYYENNILLLVGQSRNPKEQRMIDDPHQQSLQSSTEIHSISSSSLRHEINRLLMNSDHNDWERLETIFEQFKKADPSSPDIEPLRIRIAQAHMEKREKNVYEETRTYCVELWDREQELVNATLAGEAIIHKLFDPALAKVKGALNDFPDSALLKGLINEAQAKRDLARRTYEAKSTADLTKDYKTFLEFYQDQPKDKLVPWTNEHGQIQDPVSVSKAMQRVEIIAEQFAHSKLLEYFETAQKHLDDHKPRAALDYVQKGLKLFRLADSDRSFLNSFNEKNVTPLLRQLESAEKQRLLAVEADDPRQGWELLTKAVGLYHWVEGVEDDKRRLADKVLKRALDHLTQAKMNLEEYEKNRRERDLKETRKKCGSAIELLDMVRNYLSEHDDWVELNKRFNSLASLADEAMTMCNKYEDEFQDLANLAERLEGMLKKDDKSIERIWKIYEKKYGSTKLEANDRLRELRFTMDQVKGTNVVIERLEEIFSAGSGSRLKAAEGDCKKALKEKTDKQSREALQAMLKKIRIRLRYQSALKKYEDGDVEKAIEDFNWVARQDGHSDAQEAANKAKEINRMEEHLVSVQKALAQARASMESAPRRAYEILEKASQYKTRYTRNVLLLMERARNKWEKKKTAELERLLSSGKPKANKIFTLVKELSEELPDPRPTTVIENALAKAYAIEALGFAEIGNWDAAVDSWRKAMNYNSFLDEIQQGWQEARIRQTEIKLERSPSSFKADELETIVKEFSKNPEVWLLKARYEHIQSANLSYSANERINYFIRAQQALDLARDTVVSQKNEIGQSKKQISRKISDAALKIQTSIWGKKVTRLERKMNDMELEIAQGEALARSQAVVEEKLHADRGREDFEQARADARIFIEANDSAIQLNEWWQKLVKRVIGELIIKVNNLASSEDEDWEIFDIDSKILALDPNHQRAASFRRKLPDLLSNLQIEIGMKIGDKNGLETKGGVEKPVIEIQLDKLIQLRGRAQAANTLLSLLGGNHPQQGMFIQSMGSLETFIKKLIQVKNQTVQARQITTQAKLDNSWDNFDSLIFELNKAGYGEHQTVLALQEEKSTILKRREALQDSIDKIAKLCEREDGRAIERALALMADYSTNDEQGDSLDEFGLGAAIQIAPPVIKEGKAVTSKIRGWYKVQTWLMEQKKQLQSIQDWLVNCGLRDLLISNDLVPSNENPANPLGIIEWAKVKEQIEELVPKGNYPAALNKIKTALQGDKDNGWADPDGKLLALEPSRHRIINQPPVSKRDLENNLAFKLLGEAEQKGKLIGKDIDEAKSLQKEINGKRSRWGDAESELSKALNDLQNLKNKPKIFRNAMKIRQAREKVYAALYECRLIAPKHPNLTGIEDMI